MADTRGIFRDIFWMPTVFPIRLVFCDDLVAEVRDIFEVFPVYFSSNDGHLRFVCIWISMLIGLHLLL